MSGLCKGKPHSSLGTWNSCWFRFTLPGWITWTFSYTVAVIFLPRKKTMKEGDPVQHLCLGRRPSSRSRSKTSRWIAPDLLRRAGLMSDVFQWGLNSYIRNGGHDQEEKSQVNDDNLGSIFIIFSCEKQQKKSSMFLRPWITVWIVFLDWTFSKPVWVWNTWLSRLLIVHQKPYKYEYLCNQTVVLFSVQGRHIMPSFDSIFCFLLEVLGV